MKFFKLILLAVGLSGAFLFVIYFTASAKEPERGVQHFALPFQIIEILPNGEQGQSYSGQSLKTKSNEIATELGANPYPEDKFTVFPEYKGFIGRQITLYRAPSLTVIDQNKQTIYRSFTKTVGQLLEEKKIILGLDDKINFSTDSTLEPGMVIKITRVARTKIIETEYIDFKTIKKDDPTLDRGKTKISKAGVKGEKKLTYEVTRENGIEISKVLILSESVSKAVDEILLVGTKPVISVRCKFNDTVLAASIKYKQDPNALCNLMMKESNGNPNSDGGQWKGLFQYDIDFWPSVAAKAGYAGADWRNATAQIYTTAYLFSIGQSWRW